MKSPAVEPAKHGGAGRLSVEAPVRPMRVEIPSRKAGETRLSGAPKRGGAPQRPSGLKSPAVKPAKHDRAGRLSVEAPVRPMRVAARVEIPSRKAGETRLSGASKRGGVPLKADVRCSRRCLFFAYGRPRCAAISGLPARRLSPGHFGLGRRCCGRWCGVSGTVASHELFWTCSGCRAPCTFGAANRT